MASRLLALVLTVLLSSFDFGLAAVLSPEAESSPPVSLRREYRIDRWTSEHGLPQNTVRFLLQSRDGYLWIGTSYGLARYDGLRFTVYTSELEIEQPAELRVLELREDSEGRVWTRTQHGLIACDHGRFNTYSFVGQPPIATMRPSRRGGLWLAMTDGLHHFANGQFTRSFTNLAGLPANRTSLAFEDREGKLWLLCQGVRAPPFDRAWHRLDPSTGELVALETLFPGLPPDATDLTEDSAGRLWLSGPGALFRCADGGLTRYSVAAAIGEQRPSLLAPDNEGGLWFRPSEYRGVFRFFAGEVARYGKEQGLDAADIRCLLPDREGNIWIGTGERGLIRLEPRRLISLLTTNTQGSANEVFSVTPGGEEELWFGTSSGLTLHRDGRFRTYTNSFLNVHARYENAVRPLLLDHSGALWFGVSGHGLQTLRDGQFVRERAAELWPTDHWGVQALLEDPAGHLWVGTTRGLMVRRAGKFQIVSTTGGPLTNLVLGLQLAPDGALWIGTETNGLLRLRDGHAESFTRQHGLLADTAAFYRVRRVPLSQPLDTDGDGIDDAWELRFRRSGQRSMAAMRSKITPETAPRPR